MDKLLDTLNGYLKAATDTVSHYAPVAWEATLHLVFWTSLIHLIVLTLYSIVFLILWVWPWRKWMNWNIKDQWDSEGSCVGFTVCTVGFVVANVFLFFCWGNSLPDWLGVLDPKLAILYKLAVKAGVL